MEEACIQFRLEREAAMKEDSRRIGLGISNRKRKKKKRKKPMYYIEKYDSKDGPRFRIKAKNGKIIAHSEAYSSERSRDKTVASLSQNHNM